MCPHPRAPGALVPQPARTGAAEPADDTCSHKTQKGGNKQLMTVGALQPAAANTLNPERSWGSYLPMTAVLKEDDEIQLKSERFSLKNYRHMILDSRILYLNFHSYEVL